MRRSLPRTKNKKTKIMPNPERCGIEYFYFKTHVLPIYVCDCDRDYVAVLYSSVREKKIYILDSTR